LAQRQESTTTGLFGLDEPGLTAQADRRVARTRAVSAATTLLAEPGFTRLQLAAIQIDREPANHASARVAERLGAVITGSPRMQCESTEVELAQHSLNSPNRPTDRQ
jgi:hypothetical protein